jgi:hypothetical protein
LGPVRDLAAWSCLRPEVPEVPALQPMAPWTASPREKVMEKAAWQLPVVRRAVRLAGRQGEQLPQASSMRSCLRGRSRCRRRHQ